MKINLRLRPLFGRGCIFSFGRSVAMSVFATWMLTSSSLAQSEGVGRIEGRVLNATSGLYLTNARVSVEGTDHVQFTNEAGEYRLDDVAAGRVQLRVSYTGLDAQTVSVTVTPNAVASQDFQLARGGVSAVAVDDRNVIKLDEFTVVSQRETNAAAIALNEQRYSSNIKSVVSTDAYGESVDNNAAEFAKFLPGVTVEYTSGLARSISLRGFSPGFTPILIDGHSIASTGVIAFDRTAEMEAVATSSVARVEVHKVALPDMASEGLGGTVNMVSRSAFERSRPQLTLLAGTQFTAERAKIWEKAPHREGNRAMQAYPILKFGYINPITKNIGVALSGDFISSERDFHRATSGWNFSQTGVPAVTPATPFLRNYSVIGGPSGSERGSLSGRVDWRPWQNHKLSFSTSWVGSEGSYIQNSLAFDTGAADLAGGFAFGPDFTDGRVGAGRTTFGTNTRHKFAESYTYSVAHTFTGRRWETEMGVNYTEGKTAYRVIPDGRVQNYSFSSVAPLTIKYRNIEDGRPRGTSDIIVTDASGVPFDPYQINNYRLTGISELTEDGSDFKHTYYANVKRHLDFLPFPASIKLGTHVRTQLRDKRGMSHGWTYLGPDGLPNNDDNRLDDAYAMRDDRAGGFFGLPGSIEWPSPFRINELFKDHPEWFSYNPVSAESNRIQNSEHFEETISSHFARGDFRLFQGKLQVAGGVRYEKTEDYGEGRLQLPQAVWQRDAAGNFIRDAQGNRVRRPEAGAVGSMEELRLTSIERGAKAERDYHHYNPSLSINYFITENLKLAAGFAKVLGRPNISNIIPNININENAEDPSTGTISVRNTGLRPWTAKNYALSLEYYYGQNGFATIGAFRNEVSGFFTTSPSQILTPELLTELGLEERYVGWTYTGATFNSNGTAVVHGIEAGVQQGLAILGGWAAPFRFGANLTLNQVEGPSGANLQSTTPKTGNIFLSYSKGRLIARLNWNYRGRQVRGGISGRGPGPAFLYWAPQQQLEANLEYKLNRQLAIVVTSRNLLRQGTVEEAYGAAIPYYARITNDTPGAVFYMIGVRGTF